MHWGVLVFPSFIELRILVFFCFGLWLIKRGILYSEAPFKWFMTYRTRNVTFEARFLWFMAYGTRNATFEARLVWCMAYRPRNIFTFEASFLWFMAYGTRNATFEARLFRYMAYRTRNIFTFEVRASCGLWLIEQSVIHLKRTCFGLCISND